MQGVLLPQEAVQVTESDVVQAWHDVLQGDSLQIELHDVPQQHSVVGTGAPPPYQHPPERGFSGLKIFISVLFLSTSVWHCILTRELQTLSQQ